jgi:hypothetical protein
LPTGLLLSLLFAPEGRNESSPGSQAKDPQARKHGFVFSVVESR